MNYCYAPPAGTLIVMGDEDEPAANFPLGECEGDCDNDGDCAVCVLSFVSIVNIFLLKHAIISSFCSFVCRDLLFASSDLVLKMSLVVSEQVSPEATTATITSRCPPLLLQILAFP